MAYTRQYLETHDIDWFCMINGHFIHGASNGGEIPPYITMQSNRDVMEVVGGLPLIVGEDSLEYNEQELTKQLTFVMDYHLDVSYDDARDRYLETFKLMAMKGFCSFDRVTDIRENKGKYVWLVRPRENWNIWKRIDIRVPRFWIDRSERDIDEFDVRSLDLPNGEPRNI